MCLKKQVRGARIAGSTTAHRLINLSGLTLETVTLPKLSLEKALPESVQIASKKKLSGYVLHCKSGYVNILSIKTAEIPRSHPQIVKQLRGSDYCLMRNHTVV